jgi:hypothetical protein
MQAEYDAIASPSDAVAFLQSTGSYYVDYVELGGECMAYLQVSG